MARRPSRIPDGNTRGIASLDTPRVLLRGQGVVGVRGAMGGRVWRHPITKDNHRIDGPCFEMTDGAKEWHEHGVCLRVEQDQGCYDTPEGVLVKNIKSRYEGKIAGLLQRIMLLEEEVERLKHG